MGRTVSIGAQGFEALRVRNNFYVDKTEFIHEWWNSDDQITLITRPRRFGKTLMLDTVRCFFSPEFAGRGEELFGGLSVWEDPEMRLLQGAVPVIFVSFASVKEADFSQTMEVIKDVLSISAAQHRYLMNSEFVDTQDKEILVSINRHMSNVEAYRCLNLLCRALEAHWGTKPIVLLDEYDTPMHAAWLGGYWNELSVFMRSFMDSTFKTNPSLARGLMTGITRVAKESMFSGLNNLSVCTVTTPAYQTAFGFTEKEVFSSLEEYGLEDQQAKVQEWYDGFCFGGVESIYNPWSITEYLKRQRIMPYWMNTSDNALAAQAVQMAGIELKIHFENLLSGKSITEEVDEQVIFSDISKKKGAVWSLLLASGYITSTAEIPETNLKTLRLTNKEVQISFDRMMRDWFESDDDTSYSSFVKAILTGDTKPATHYLQEVTLACMSSFDSATKPAEKEPERFYHGLVLGLLASLRGRFTVESNRESGWGRYDIMLVPTGDAQATDPAIIIEFKVFDPDEEMTLEDTAARALAQIEEKAYATTLIERGIAAERILSYGIAFKGKEVLVAKG